jgi:hypothetical protein
MSTHVIVNTGDPPALLDQVRQVFDAIRAKR